MLAVKDLPWNPFKVKMFFHFHDYPTIPYHPPHEHINQVFTAEG